ncbi:DNA gyrase inhibitor YacG [Thiolapillus sp.]
MCPSPSRPASSETKRQPVRVVACPTCGKPVKWAPESRWRPFCCERCKLIDLGEWLSDPDEKET